MILTQDNVPQPDVGLMDEIMEVACEFYDKTYPLDSDDDEAEEGELVDPGIQDVEWQVGLWGDTKYAVVISDSPDADEFRMALAEELWARFPNVAVYVEVGH